MIPVVIEQTECLARMTLLRVFLRTALSCQSWTSQQYGRNSVIAQYFSWMPNSTIYLYVTLWRFYLYQLVWRYELYQVDVQAIVMGMAASMEF